MQGSQGKERKGIVAASFRELVEKGEIFVFKEDLPKKIVSCGGVCVLPWTPTTYGAWNRWEYHRDKDHTVDISARSKFPTEEENGESLTLVLAEDRTEVDDEEYFQTLGGLVGVDGDDDDADDDNDDDGSKNFSLPDDNTLFLLAPRREGKLRSNIMVDTFF